MDTPSIETLLRQAREQSGALAVAWTGSQGRVDVPARGGPPWDAGLGLGEGRVLRLGPGATARRPRLAVLGARYAAVRCEAGTRTALGGTGPLRLAFAGSGGLSIADEAVEALFTALAALEQERAQAELARRRTALAHLGRAAGGAAHDLRNELSAALLQLDALDLGLDGAADGLRTSVRTARDLARDFLELEPLPSRARVDLAGVLRHELARMPAQAVETRGLEQPVWVAGRRDLVARIAANLVTNAAQASVRGQAVEVDVVREGARVRLTILDHGRGMDQARLDRYLESGATRRGSGFGTASVRHCLARVGGRLWIESVLHRGTRCVIEFLSAPPPARPAALIHDPDPVARWSWREVAEGQGLEALEAASGEEALAWIESGELGLVLTARSAPGSTRVVRAARRRGVPALRTGVQGPEAASPSQGTPASQGTAEPALLGRVATPESASSLERTLGA